MAGEFSGAVVELEVEEGNKPNQPIGSYRPGRRTSYLVFLPPNTTVGKTVRVKLVDTGKTDRGGNSLYRGVADEDQKIERWRDNGDGTASKVVYVRDWLLEEKEFAVDETHKLETQVSTVYRSSINGVMVWGTDLTSSVFMEEEVKRYIINTEKVVSGSIEWKESGEQPIPQPTTDHPITQLSDFSGSWFTKKLEAVWNPDSEVSFSAYYNGGYYSRHSFTFKYSVMPEWWRKETESNYPLCSCGRNRINTLSDDKYPKCETCRKEDICVRCNHKTTVKNLAGRFICSVCEPYEATEQMIRQKVSLDRLKILASEATRLATGQFLPEELGMQILTALVGDFDEYARQKMIEKWQGYSWYVFTDDGVFGTKLADGAITIFQFVANAQGNGFVDMFAWLNRGHRNFDKDVDFYTQTQVMGKTSGVLRDQANTLQDIADGKLGLAVWLRGSEKDRVAAAAAIREFQQEFGDADLFDDSMKVGDYKKVIKDIDSQRYHRVERRKRIEAGEIWPDVEISLTHSGNGRSWEHLWIVAADGSINMNHASSNSYCVSCGDTETSNLVISHGKSDYGYQDIEWWTVHKLPRQVTQAQRDTLKRLEDDNRVFFCGKETGWKLKTEDQNLIATAYRRDFTGSDAVAHEQMRSSHPIDVSRWDLEIDSEGKKTLWHRVRRSPNQKAIDKLADQIQNLEGLIMALGYEKDDAEVVYDQALMELLERDECENGSAPVLEGTVFEIPNFVKESKDGKDSLVYGPFYDWKSSGYIKLILDGYDKNSSKINEGSKKVLVRVRARNSAQLHLFETFLRPMSGGHKQKTYGYFVTPILHPEVFDLEVLELEEQLEELRKQLEKLKTTPPVFEKAKLKHNPEGEVTYHDDTASEGYGILANAFAKVRKNT